MAPNNFLIFFGSQFGIFNLSTKNWDLGDIVNGAPVFVKVPPFKYADSGYAAFVAANAGRAGTVYVATTGDETIHALDTTTQRIGRPRGSLIDHHHPVGRDPIVGICPREVCRSGGDVFVAGRFGGVRNPFRAGFDMCTGDLYIGDVGQGRREEIDVVPAGRSRFNTGFDPLRSIVG